MGQFEGPVVHYSETCPVRSKYRYIAYSWGEQIVGQPDQQ